MIDVGGDRRIDQTIDLVDVSRLSIIDKTLACLCSLICFDGNEGRAFDDATRTGNLNSSRRTPLVVATLDYPRLYQISAKIDHWLRQQRRCVMVSRAF